MNKSRQVSVKIKFIGCAGAGRHQDGTFWRFGAEPNVDWRQLTQDVEKSRLSAIGN